MKNSAIPDILTDENALTDYRKLHHLIVIDKQGKLSTNGNFTTLQQILGTGCIHSKIARSFPVKELIQPENFISLLYYFGLLTLDGIDEENKAILKIPNESVRRLYYDFIRKTYEETGVFSFKLNELEIQMKEMAFNGNWKPLIEYIAGKLNQAQGVRDLFTAEKSIQAFFNVYLGLSEFYLIYSEKELNKGYADLVMVPFLIQFPMVKYAYIIEIKYTKPLGSVKSKIPVKRIQFLGKEAEIQLNHYIQDEKFSKSIGNTTLKKLVLIFSGAQLVYSNEV